MAEKVIKVVELFAGVGGFRVGLERSSNAYKTVWANQWEPGKVAQYAFDCYAAHFGKSKNHVNEDISLVKNQVPSHDLLVGGFPCQDYSVASTGAKGIEGKKGVLWWEINDIVRERRPSYVLLENVDRLIKSPTAQRGRDFGIILRCLSDLGYAVEWRVINAAEYGNAQRRRRIFIFAYNERTPIYQSLLNRLQSNSENVLFDWLYENGFYAPAFPLQESRNPSKRTVSSITGKDYKTLADVSDSFKAPFYNSGVMIKGHIFSEDLMPKGVPPIPLKEIRQKEPVAERFFINGSLEKWEYLKGSKKIPRIGPNGNAYVFSEGGMCFPDDIEKPARTMLTSESSINRSTHVIEDAETGRLRLLTPLECERLNGFDDDWTNTGMPERIRYFTMGNALIVPVITKIGNRLLEIL
ncbi:MAG: DNA (cytosine-5-)-methyltransferase [Syntrophomonadaceae bacterium]|nr:DNA (cytosine-5-)-methyltransferase [Syntrophomonadaceae bacterium]